MILRSVISNILMNNLPYVLKQKFQKLLFQNDNLENNNSFINAEIRNSLNKNLMMSAVHLVSRSGIAAIAAEMGGGGAAAVVLGPPGWIVGGALIITITLSDYFGIWIRNNCFEDLVKSFYNFIKANLDNLIAKTSESWNLFISNLDDHLSQLKETSNKITILYQILNNYETKKINPIKETSEELFQKALKEFEEKYEIKNIFSKIILN